MVGRRVVLAGAAIGNGNRGVEALGRSVVDAVQRDSPGATLSILDDGWGVRHDPGPRHPDIGVEMVGVRQSRRWYRPESWAQIRLAQATLPRLNPVATRLGAADLVLDLSAGDSFTDLYGPARLNAITLPKRAALRAGRPLVLLPQTYGPFTSPRSRHLAGELIRAATIAYARDPWSYQQLLDLAGPDADQSRLRDGVDVAFALEPRRPDDVTAQQVERSPGDVTVGVNVSGLLLDGSAHARFGLAGNYLDTMTALVAALTDRGAQVVLVPHVHVGDGRGESDINAIDQLRARLPPSQRASTSVLPTSLDASQVKWCISQLDWFVGSRMHATIAALSTFTPVAAYAYSDKTRGVFETCGVGEACVDARAVSGSEAVARMVDQFERRTLTRDELAHRAAATVRRSREQLREVLRIGADRPRGRTGSLS